MLADQPGFTLQQRKTLTDILQRSHGMYPSRIAWDTQALATTEQFFRINSTDPDSVRLSFADFVRDPHGNEPH